MAIGHTFVILAHPTVPSYQQSGIAHFLLNLMKWFEVFTYQKCCQLSVIGLKHFFVTLEFT